MFPERLAPDMNAFVRTPTRREMWYRCILRSQGDVRRSTSMNRSLVVLATLLIACTAGAQELASGDALLAPLPIRDQFLLSNGLLSFAPEGPRVLDRGAWSMTFAGAD